MRINWEFDQQEVINIKRFVFEHYNNSFVQARKAKNIDRQGIILTKDTIIRAMLMCLLTTMQPSGPASPISRFLEENPFPITQEELQDRDIKTYIYSILKERSLKRFIKKIPEFFTLNYARLSAENWSIIPELQEMISNPATLAVERVVADSLQRKFKGFGPKQSRNFLQHLGITQHEIPIDSRIIKWLKKYHFPIPVSSIMLQDVDYYHFISDGIFLLCKQINILPCLLDAVIFSSYNIGEYNDFQSMN